MIFVYMKHSPALAYVINVVYCFIFFVTLMAQAKAIFSFKLSSKILPCTPVRLPHCQVVYDKTPKPDKSSSMQ